MTADIAIACICALNVILNCYIILKKLNPAPINITKHETVNWEEYEIKSYIVKREVQDESPRV